MSLGIHMLKLKQKCTSLELWQEGCLCSAQHTHAQAISGPTSNPFSFHQGIAPRYWPH